MRRSNFKRARRRGNGLTILTVVSIAGIACLLAGWNAHTARNTDPSPAEIVALRFPDPRNDLWNDVADARADAANADDVDARQYSLFSPYPTMAPADTAAAPASYQTASLGSTPVELAPEQTAPARDTGAEAEPKLEANPETKPVAVHAKPPAPPRSARRPGAVLSEGQIASIKTRLHLTPDQQEMWPAVEQALRNLSYSKKPENGFRGEAGGTRTAEIDPGSEEVQRLKSAAFPLIMSFSDEQKRELRILAQVAGLEKLAPQF